MQTIRNWTAKRSGAGITITGITAYKGVDNPAKLVGVDEIKLDGATVVAVRGKERFQLEV